jgi:uncharacterized protein YjbJ (UPF0337 family)
VEETRNAYGRTTLPPRVGGSGRPNHEENTVSWDRLEGNWKQLSGKVKQKWAKLTDDDLDMIEGKTEELAGKIQERYGKSRDDARREVDEWRQSL